MGLKRELKATQTLGLMFWAVTGKGESEAMEKGVEDKKRERENGERDETEEE